MSAWKAALVLLAGLGASFPACAQLQADEEREEIRAHDVRVIDRRLHDASPSGLALSARIVTIHDRQGNLVESIGYGASGELRSRSRYKYDAGNRLVDYVTEPAHEVFQDFTAAYKLDQKGRVTEATYRDAGGKVRGSQRLTRDEAGRIVEEASYDATGRSTGSARRRYDSDGNEVEWTSMNGEGEVVQRREYTFRKTGQPARTLIYDSTDRLVQKSESVYAGERLSEERSFRADGTLYQRVLYERNASGLVTKETMFEDGKVISVEEKSYELHP